MKVDAWTNKEEKYLRKHYRTSELLAIAKALGKSISNVERKCQRLGLAKRNKWTPDMELTLRRMYPRCDLREISDRLGGMRINLIRRKASSLGISRTINQAQFTGTKLGRPKIRLEAKRGRPRVKPIPPPSRDRGKIYKTRKIEFSSLRSIRINHKTVLQLPSHLTEQEVDKIVKRYKKLI